MRPIAPPVVLAVAAPAALPNERPRPAETPTPVVARCDRCLRPLLPGDPDCRWCFASVNGRVLR
jgi:hypothetical protein